MYTTKITLGNGAYCYLSLPEPLKTSMLAQVESCRDKTTGVHETGWHARPALHSAPRYHSIAHRMDIICQVGRYIEIP
jgi:hypothetical protein